MSEDLEARFAKAAQDVNNLSKPPESEMLLTLYSLYKQGTIGDCTGDRPGQMDFIGCAKFDAWTRVAGTSKDQAMEDYIAQVAELVASDAG